MLNRLIIVGIVALSLPAMATEADAQCGGVPRNSGPAPATPSPATPATPSPATPATPSPATPSTPTPGGPTPAASGPSTPRGGPCGGIPIVMTRQATSREILSIDWDYPTRVVVKQKKTNQTSAVPILRALPKERAFMEISKNDKRPLLILRECNACKGTDFAFLNRKLDNEKTMLLARWFHCVKLPPSVMHPTHHFRNLFQGTKVVPHLFICNLDGSNMQPFDGRQSQSDMQKAMTKMIHECYAKKPQVALRAMLRFLSDFDMYDTRVKTLLQQVKKELYAKGESSKWKKLNNKLDEVEAKKAKAMKLAKAVCDLKLKVAAAPKPKKAAAGGSR